MISTASTNRSLATDEQTPHANGEDGFGVAGHGIVEAEEAQQEGRTYSSVACSLMSSNASLSRC